MSETRANLQQQVAEQTAPVSAAGRTVRVVELETFGVYPVGLEMVAGALPWVTLAFAGVAFVIYRADVMFISGLLAATLAGFLVRMLGPRVPEALTSLWTRNLLAPRNRADPALESQFAAFLCSFQHSLNSRWSWALGAFFAVAAVPQFFLSLSIPDPLEVVRRAGVGALLAILSDWWVVGLVVVAAIGLCLGLLAWRMVCIGYYVHRLGAKFDCRVQTQHPDGAGGFGGLGEVCFLNALIVIVPSIFLGVWRTLIANVPAYNARYGYLTDWFGALLLVTFVLAIVAFAAPLYGVHRAMARYRALRQEDLDKIGNAMDGLTQRIRTAAESGDSQRASDLKQQHAELSEFYSRELDAPTWPVDARLMRRYFLTQIVPLLSVTKVTDAIASRLLGGS